MAPRLHVVVSVVASLSIMANLDQLLAVLPAAAGGNGWFYNGTVGTGADQVFGLTI
ncbi:hypothetical protein ACP70R_032489 [Stipagrostis hirtigluma subsp. patula]